MRMKPLSLILAMGATIITLFSAMPADARIGCGEHGWDKMCCGEAMCPESSDDPAHWNATCRDFSDAHTQDFDFVETCCPERLASIDAVGIEITPAKFIVGQFGTAAVIVTNESSVNIDVDVNIKITCNQGDSAEQAFTNHTIGAGETHGANEGFALQFMGSAPGDCRITATVRYAKYTGCAKTEVVTLTTKTWVVAPPPDDDNTCTCTCTPTTCEKCQTCEVCTPCQPQVNNDPCLHEGFKDVLWACKTRQMAACPGRLTRAEKRRIMSTCRSLLRYCKYRKTL